MQPDRPTAIEFDAYIDGELGLGERLAVEDYLARHPREASRLMADLRARTALRLMQPPAPATKAPGLRRLFRRLHHASSRPLHIAFTAAAVGVITLSLQPRISDEERTLLSGAGEAASHQEARSSGEERGPPYIADALQAYRTGIIRAGMLSQVESAVIDAPEILRATSIPVPSLPEGWKVTDVQIFPSDQGPALQIMVETPEKKKLSVFAVRTQATVASSSPVAVQRKDAAVAYWRDGDIAYALTGADTPELLDLAAEDIADGTS